jgi:hypothetical protein
MGLFALPQSHRVLSLRKYRVDPDEDNADENKKYFSVL